MTQPVICFTQGPAIESLCSAFGYGLEGLSRDHQLCLVHALATALLCEGGLEASLLESEVLQDTLLPDELIAIVREIEVEGRLEDLLLAVAWQIATPAQVAAVAGR